MLHVFPHNGKYNQIVPLRYLKLHNDLNFIKNQSKFFEYSNEYHYSHNLYSENITSLKKMLHYYPPIHHVKNMLKLQTFYIYVERCLNGMNTIFTNNLLLKMFFFFLFLQKYCSFIP